VHESIGSDGEQVADHLNIHPLLAAEARLRLQRQYRASWVGSTDRNAMDRLYGLDLIAEICFRSAILPSFDMRLVCTSSNTRDGRALDPVCASAPPTCGEEVRRRSTTVADTMFRLVLDRLRCGGDEDKVTTGHGSSRTSDFRSRKAAALHESLSRSPIATTTLSCGHCFLVGPVSRDYAV
jgi:hypothetical protein